MTTERELLEQARDALWTCTPGDYSTGHVVHPDYDAEKVAAVLAAIGAYLLMPPPVAGTYHIYACSREEPGKRVRMYQCDTQQSRSVAQTLGLHRSDPPVSPGDGRPEFAGYYVDAMGGLWWVKRYD